MHVPRLRVNIWNSFFRFVRRHFARARALYILMYVVLCPVRYFRYCRQHGILNELTDRFPRVVTRRQRVSSTVGGKHYWYFFHFRHGDGTLYDEEVYAVCYCAAARARPFRKSCESGRNDIENETRAVCKFIDFVWGEKTKKSLTRTKKKKKYHKSKQKLLSAFRLVNRVKIYI